MELLKNAKFHLHRITKLNGYLNAFVNLAEKGSIFEKLENSSKRQYEGLLLSQLDGKFIAIKDNICTNDMPTTCSSRILEHYVSPYEATIVTKLREAGAIIIGKTNMDEFSIGSTTTHSIFGPTLNPVDSKVQRSPGGSSGGSASAVSADMCYSALGTDTGGSIRLPASYCNCVGFKPSYGLISRWGVVSYSNSMDTVGILATTVQRVRETFNILNFYDPKDPTSLPNEERSKLKEFDKHKKIIIGVPLDFNISSILPSIKHAWKEAIQYLKLEGFDIVPIRLPNIKYSPMVYDIITSVEASSNLAKYTGFIYGYSPNTNTDKNMFQKTRDEGFGTLVKQKILMGVYYSFNYFQKAQKIRRLIKNDFDSVFTTLNEPSDTIKENKADILITPTSANSAPSIENTTKEISLLDMYVGIPAISVPFSNNEEGLPIGIQLMASYGYDSLLLEVAEILEKKSLNNKKALPTH
ncbi:hypothetical protein PCANB_001550 [Pneumocystis canis]|nr:hypothetical protein PCANB_001550 [Pneumocystis canis]